MSLPAPLRLPLLPPPLPLPLPPLLLLLLLLLSPPAPLLPLPLPRVPAPIRPAEAHAKASPLDTSLRNGGALAPSELALGGGGGGGGGRAFGPANSSQTADDAWSGQVLNWSSGCESQKSGLEEEAAEVGEEAEWLEGRPSGEGKRETEAAAGVRSRRGLSQSSSSSSSGGEALLLLEDDQVMQAQLVELLAEYYARSATLRATSDSIERRLGLVGRQLAELRQTSGKLDVGAMEDARHQEQLIRAHLGLQLEASQTNLSSWLLEQKSRFAGLENITIDVVPEPPSRVINVCDDGPKILVLLNASNVFYCYTRKQWLAKLWSDVRPSTFHYPFLLLNILIFLFGTFGNMFVCLSVKRNHQLRNVTNYFIVNLAFADFLVILICLPATVAWDISLTWFFDTLLCKSIMFLQVSAI